MPINVEHEQAMLDGVNGDNLDNRVWLFSRGVETQAKVFSDPIVHCQDEQGRWMPLEHFAGGNKRGSLKMRSLPHHEKRKALHGQYAAIVRAVVSERYQKQFLATLQEQLPVYEG